MADSSSSSGSATTVIVGVVAVIAIAFLVYFAFLRGGGEAGGTDIDVNVDPGGAIEDVVPDGE